MKRNTSYSRVGIVLLGAALALTFLASYLTIQRWKESVRPEPAKKAWWEERFSDEHNQTFKRAESAYLAGDLPRVQEISLDLLAAEKDDFRVWRLLVDSYFAQRDYEKCLESIREARSHFDQMSPDERPRDLFEIVGVVETEAYVSLHREDLAGVRRLAGEIADLDAKDYRSYKLLAIAADKQGDADAAMGFALQAWEHGGAHDPAIRRIVKPPEDIESGS